MQTEPNEPLEAARLLTQVRATMLKLGLLIEGSSYDKQLKGLTSRCVKAAAKLAPTNA